APACRSLPCCAPIGPGPWATELSEHPVRPRDLQAIAPQASGASILERANAELPLPGPPIFLPSRFPTAHDFQCSIGSLQGLIARQVPISPKKQMGGANPAVSLQPRVRLPVLLFHEIPFLQLRSPYSANHAPSTRHP